MPMYIHNTATRKKELFEPADPNRVTMYVCGPTVYNFAHIGNGRPYVVFDVLARLLRRSGKLVYARNLTDVDDKINAAAKGEGVDIGVLTGRFVDAFREDMAALGVLPPDVEPRVTEHIPQILDFIERLIAAGHAYEAEGHVLFSVASYPAYGALSGRELEDMIAGARVEVAPYKRGAADFVLWKPSERGVVGWDSPWGRGRPGWHIECSAMVEAHLGETIDIHGGGLDLVFPHHENETAQSTCVHGGRSFSRYWVHNGFVNMGSDKMSKSVGNMVLIRELLEEHDGEAIRLCLLTAHYRQPLEWSSQLLEDAEQKLDRMYGALRDAGITGEQTEAPADEPPAAVIGALEDDLNTPEALAKLFNLARAANKSTDPAERREHARTLRAGAWLLGLLHREPQRWFEAPRAAEDESDLTEADIDALVARRETLRKERHYAEADEVRDRLLNAGILVEDVAGGSRWRRAR